MTHICTISSSQPLFDTDLEEYGIFTLEVHVSMIEAAATGDAKGFITHKIGEALAGCVVKTKLPPNEGLWAVEFSRFAQNNFNFPEGFIA